MNLKAPSEEIFGKSTTNVVDVNRWR